MILALTNEMEDYRNDSVPIFPRLWEIDREMGSYIWENHDGGASWWSLIDMAIVLAAILGAIYLARMAYKMMLQDGEIDILGLLRPLFVSLALTNYLAIAMSVTGIAGGIENRFRSGYTVNANAAQAARKLRNQYQDTLYQVMSSMQGQVMQLKALEKELNQERNGEEKEVTDMSVKPATTADILAAHGADIYDASDDPMAGRQVERYIEEANINRFIDSILIWLGELLWQIGAYFAILAKNVTLCVLVYFGPVTIACCLTEQWKDAWLTWIASLVTVSLYGVAIYLIMSVCSWIMAEGYQMEAGKIMNVLKGGQEQIYAYMKSGGSAGQATGFLVMAAQVIGFIALLGVPSFATFMFPAAGVNAASEFIKGMTDAAKGALQSTAHASVKAGKAVVYSSGPDGIRNPFSAGGGPVRVDLSDAAKEKVKDGTAVQGLKNEDYVKYAESHADRDNTEGLGETARDNAGVSTGFPHAAQTRPKAKMQDYGSVLEELERMEKEIEHYDEIRQEVVSDLEREAASLADAEITEARNANVKASRMVKELSVTTGMEKRKELIRKIEEFRNEIVFKAGRLMGLYEHEERDFHYKSAIDMLDMALYKEKEAGGLSKMTVEDLLAVAERLSRDSAFELRGLADKQAVADDPEIIKMKGAVNEYYKEKETAGHILQDVRARVKVAEEEKDKSRKDFLLSDLHRYRDEVIMEAAYLRFKSENSLRDLMVDRSIEILDKALGKEDGKALVLARVSVLKEKEERHRQEIGYYRYVRKMGDDREESRRYERASEQLDGLLGKESPIPGDVSQSSDRSGYGAKGHSDDADMAGAIRDLERLEEDMVLQENSAKARSRAAADISMMSIEGLDADPVKEIRKAVRNGYWTASQADKVLDYVSSRARLEKDLPFWKEAESLLRTQIMKGKFR